MIVSSITFWCRVGKPPCHFFIVFTPALTVISILCSLGVIYQVDEKGDRETDTKYKMVPEIYNSLRCIYMSVGYLSHFDRNPKQVDHLQSTTGFDCITGNFLLYVLSSDTLKPVGVH